MVDLDADAESETADAVEVEVFDRKRQAQLARSLAALDRRDPLDRDQVLAGAAEVLTPSPAVANALDLPMYLDPVDAEE